MSTASYASLNALVEILEPFYQATVATSSQNEVTISKVLPILNARIKALEAQQRRTGSVPGTPAERISQIMLTILLRRKADYEDESNVALLGSLLDPRFKGGFLSRETESMLNALLKAIDENPIPTQAQTSSRENCQEDVEAMLFGPRESFAEEQLTFSEVFAYRMEKDLDWKANPLIWWRENQKKLPKFSKLVMRTLSAQATEVPSKRAFSAAGLLHTKGRRRQLPGTLCRRLFVYANHPSLLQTRQHQPDSSDDEDEH